MAYGYPYGGGYGGGYGGYGEYGGYGRDYYYGDLESDHGYYSDGYSDGKFDGFKRGFATGIARRRRFPSHLGDEIVEATPDEIRDLPRERRLRFAGYEPPRGRGRGRRGRR